MRSRHLNHSSLVALLVAAAPLMAQGISAQLGGRVLDTKGAPVAGATVVIRNGETGLNRTLQTNGEGRYLATLLPVGPYTVTVTKTGFQTASNVKVNLNLGDAAPLTIRLANETSATVEVVAASTGVDTERATTATNMSPEALVNLPVKGRSFTDFAFLTPQVTLADRGNIAIGGQRGINTSINIDGGDFNEAFFGGATGSAEGKTPFTVSIEAIREFQVITDGASAEFGRMGGGYLNAITKNGTNDFSGSAFFYKRPKSLVAKQPKLSPTYDNSIPEFKTEQYGFSAGGPIIKDKLFYFVAFDGQKDTRPVNFQWGGTNSAANLITPLDPTVVGQANDAALLSRAGVYSIRANSGVVFGRLDWIVNTDHSLQFRINRSTFTGDTNTGQTLAYDTTSTDEVKTLSFIGQWNWTIGSNWVNEFRISTTKDELPRHQRSGLPQVQISNVGTYGKYPFTREFETRRTQFTETLSYVTPTVQIKGGIDFNRSTVSETFAPFVEGSFSFRDTPAFIGTGTALNPQIPQRTALQNFRLGNWTSYQQNFGLNGLTGTQAGTIEDTEKELALFLQTDWKLANEWKVGLGLRYDRQRHPDFGIADFTKNPAAYPASSPVPPALTGKIRADGQFSPRLAITWTPEADKGSTVVRFNVGRYVSRTPSVFLYQVETVNGQRTGSYTLNAQSTSNGSESAAVIAAAAALGITRGATWNPNAPGVLSAPPLTLTGSKSDIFTFDPNFRNPHTDRLNLGADRAYGDWVLGINLAYAMSENLERLKDVNLGAPVANASGRLVFPGTRPNVNYNKMMVYVSDASSRYQALTLSAKYQKADSPFQAQFFYTFAQDRDNDSNERNFSSYSVQNTQRLDDDYGYSNNDRRHVITGYFSYLEPITKIQSGFNLRYLSGTPYSLTNSGDLNADGVSGNDRLYIGGVDTGRNSQRQSSRTYVDLKLSRDWTFAKRIKFTVSAEVFNLLNRAETYTNYRFTGTDASPVLQTSNAVVSAPREVQLGARFAF